MAENVDHVPRDLGAEGLALDRAAAFHREQHLQERVAARQATNMGGEDA